MNKTFIDDSPKVTKGYQGFPLDGIVNFTAPCGYAIPIFKQILDPGDRVKIRSLLRTTTQPFTRPAKSTIIERIEWYAVPIMQLYKAFSPKFTGVSDVETDMYPNTFTDDKLPYVTLQNLSTWMRALPPSFEVQQQIPTSIPTFSEAKRLCDALGYPMSLGYPTMDGDGNTLQWNHSVSALFPAAYQKIYYDHYRITDRVPNDPAAYNLDSFYNSTSVDNTGYRLNKLFMLRKRPYQRDYFTSMDTAPLFGTGSANSSSIDIGQVNQWLSGLSGVITASPDTSTVLPKGGITASETGNPTTTRIPSSTSATSASLGSVANYATGVLNPANIRSLFAVEKLLQVTRKAKKHYDKQILAHFGVKVPKGLAGECFKIGTHEQYIKIGDVIGTAELNQGVKTGVGESNGQSKTFTFEADCHCVLMGIYSAEPIMNYPNTGLDRLNTMVRASDFYKPEFDELGQQPIFAYELYDDLTLASDSAKYDGVLGWQDRYSQLKATYNRSFGGCVTGFFSEWVLNRLINSSSISGFSRYFFEIWPTDMNNILVTPFTGAIAGVSSSTLVDSVYAFDYLICQAYLDVVKVSKKSIHGTPNLG